MILSSLRYLAVANQGGELVVRLKVAFLKAIFERTKSSNAVLAVLTKADADLARQLADFPLRIVSFEDFRDADNFDLKSEVERVATDYDANWSAIIASERSFVDSSLLLGGAGERSEPRSYVERLLVDFIRFFECVLKDRFDLVIAQTPDTLMTYVLYKIAAGMKQPVQAISPAWLSEGGTPSGFITEDEFLHSPAMRAAYHDLCRRTLTPMEIVRADAFRETILTFDGNKSYQQVSGTSFGRSALSPNIRRLWFYLRTNRRRRAEIEFFKVDPAKKLKANILRVWRKRAARKWLGTATTDVPSRSVFYPLHFQPEASTLVGGIFYANQLGLVEAIAKSLPLGWTLVVKEHPAGRGARPEWQYRHISHFHNVVFCDRPSREIAARCDAVVAITGTIAVESMALDRPVIMFGDWFYDHADVLYRVKSFDALPALFRRLLIGREYEARTDRADLIRKFLLSYLEGLVPAYPRPESADVFAERLIAIAQSLSDGSCRNITNAADVAKV